VSDISENRARRSKPADVRDVLEQHAAPEPAVDIARMRQTGVVSDEVDRSDVQGRAATADRLDGLADVAELMDDSDGALRLRREASELRVAAMRLLDE
jgi:hypothetical protein